MFSSSVAGGSICLGCQLRAVTRRVAAPVVSTAAQTRIRNRKRRYYASRTTKPRVDDFAAIIESQRHSEPKRSPRNTPADDWEFSKDTIQNATGEVGKNEKGGYTGSNKSRHASHGQTEPIRQDDFIEQAIGGQFYPDEPSDTTYGLTESMRQENGRMQQDIDDGVGIVRRQPVGVRFEGHKPLKTYWKGDTQLVQDFRKLSVGSLGREADIIVLKEGGNYKKKRAPEVEKTPQDGDPEFEAFVDQEPGLSLDTVMENIEEFRPQHRILPAREFKVLFDSLMKSFTSPQMAEYVTRYHRRIDQGDEPPSPGTLPSSETQRPWIVSEMRWIPEVRGAVPNIEHSLQGYILKSMPAKQRRVMQVMRECWGMSVQELTHGLGALEVQVRDLEFKLLTLGTQRWLQQITRLYLGQGKGKSISVVKSRSLLRIVAPKAIAESCLDAIDKTLQKTQSKTFSMDKTTFANLDPGVVEELGQLTNSVLSLDNTRNEIQVTWIDYQNRSTSELEDLGDTVFRLLLTGNPPSNVEHSLKIYPYITNKTRLIEDLSSKDKLPWMHRRMRWARVCLPASSTDALLEEAWSSKDNILKYEVISMPQDFVVPESQLSNKINKYMAAKMEAINDIVESRTGAKLRPLTHTKERLVSSNAPEGELHISSELDTSGEEQAKHQEAKAPEEDQSSSEPDAPVDERPKLQELQEPDEVGTMPRSNASAEERVEPDRSPAPEELGTLLEPDTPVEKRGGAPESQVSKDVQGLEELQSSSEPEVLDVEQAKPQEFQADEEDEVSEELQTAVETDTLAEEGLERERAVSDALETAASTLQPRWSPFRVRTNAVFGHVLHHFQPDWIHSADKAVTTTKALASSPRIISPLIPPVTKMELKGWVPYSIPSNMTSMVVMRFVPSNEMSPSAQQTNPAPLLELRMKASDEEILEIESLRAVARTHVSDILFPSELVDVRTTQRLEAELPGAMVDSMAGMSPLLTFLTNSKLEIREGKLLTPPRITDLGLPQWMFRDHHHEFVAYKQSLTRSESATSNGGKEQAALGQEKEGEEDREVRHDEEATLRPTSYVFAGLEVHRALETVYDGWKLAYTSVEAGQGGGRRAELSLEALPGHDRDLRRTEEQVSSHEFLQSVYTLVRGLPGKLVKTRAPHGHKVRTTIEWLGSGKKGM